MTKRESVCSNRKRACNKGNKECASKGHSNHANNVSEKSMQDSIHEMIENGGNQNAKVKREGFD